MYKRFIAILLIAALLPTLFVPASASEISENNDGGSRYTNLLNGTFYVDDVKSTDLVYTPYSTFNAVTFKVELDDSVSCDYVMFALSASAIPTSVRFDCISFKGETSNYAVREGSTFDNNYYTCYYRVPVDPVLKTYEIVIYFQEKISKSIELLSCFGCKNILAVYDRAEFSYVTKFDGPEGVSLGKRTNAGIKFFPYTYRNDTTDDLNSVDFTIRLDSDRFTSTAIDKVSLLLTSYCETYRVTAALVPRDADTTNVVNLHCTVKTDKEWGIVSQYESGAGTVYNYTGYQIDVDLHGYDMDKYELFFYVSVDPVLFADASPVSNTRMLEITFRSIEYINTTVSVPWYTTFYQKLNFVLNNILLSVSVVPNIIDTQFENLFERLDQYFGSDDELSGQEGEMKEQASQLQQANDAMNAVEKPSIDTGAMLDQYLNFNPAGLAILSVITNNPFATAMLVVIFTFALCGYIFFGKKR